MANKETGNVVNANNFIEKVNVCDRRKADYNPTNPAIKLIALTPISKVVKVCIDVVSAARTALTKVTANRQNVYGEMDDKAGRCIHLLNSSEATKDEMKQGKSLLLKYKSQRISDLPDETLLKAQAAAKGEEAVIPKVISTSQQGFINKLGHFRDLIIFLKTVAAYKPNEADLKVEALEAIAASADGLNAEKSSAISAWLTAISDRNKKLYDEPDGAYLLSTKMMEYVAGAYGKKSDFFKELQKYPVGNK